MKHLHWLLIVVAPPTLWFVYWLTVRQPSNVLMALAACVGLIGIWVAPWSKAARLGMAVAYLPLMVLTLWFGTLALECSMGNCL